MVREWEVDKSGYATAYKALTIITVLVIWLIAIAMSIITILFALGEMAEQPYYRGWLAFALFFLSLGLLYVGFLVSTRAERITRAMHFVHMRLLGRDALDM